MRFKLHFTLNGSKQILPLNYMYPVSAWIYRVLSKADSEFTQLLHDNGYKIENGKPYKLFTFSKLSFPKKTYRLIPNSDRMEIWSRNAWLNVAFQLPEQCQTFVEGLFIEQMAYIGDKISGINLQLQSIEAISPQILNTDHIKLRTITPIVIGMMSENNRNENYILPTTEGYEKILTNNLFEKHSLTGKELPDDAEIEFKITKLFTKTELQTIKAHTPQETKVRAYHYEFELTAPTDLIETGLNAGFGSMNSLGFGYCDVMREENK